MRSLPLYRLTVLVVVLGGSVVFGSWFYADYWGDVRAAAGYAMVREATTGASEEAAVREALAVDPDNWLAHLRLGELLLFARDDGGAEAHLRAALVANPFSPRANYAMGVLLFRRGAPEAALPYFVAAAELDPGNRQYEGMVEQLRSVEPSSTMEPSG